MITTTKAVIAVDEISCYNSNFEAISLINVLEQANAVWRKNKTPIILKRNINNCQYPILYLSRYIETASQFIEFCHSHGIECGEFKESKRYNTYTEHCFLCDSGQHIKFSNFTEFNKHTEHFHDMVIYQSAHFTVKLELGSMMKGMLMINHKTHILSAAQIPSEQLNEYYQVMEDTEFLLKAVYGQDKPVIFFEHGSSPSGFSSHKRSIVHHHTHVAIGLRFDKKYLDMVCLKPVKSVFDLNGSKYFSYQEGSKGQLLAVWDPEVYVQRQYPRQIIGMMLGIENTKTNWRNEPFTKNMVDTLRDLYQYLTVNREFLSTRIISATQCFIDVFPFRSELL